MFDLSSYNTFNLTVYAQAGRVINDLSDLQTPITDPYIILGGGSDVLFTEDFAGTVLINRLQGINISKVSASLADEAGDTSKESRDGAIAKLRAQALADATSVASAASDASGASAASRAACAASTASKASTLSAGASIGDAADDYYLVRVGSGVMLDELISYLLNQGISGLENLSLIPGTVGAAPIQNVGAYGVEIGDVLVALEACDLRTGKIRRFARSECHFNYRYSIFKEPEYRHYFITEVTLALPCHFTPKQSYAGLQSNDFKDANAVRNRVIALRNDKLPNHKYVGNAGSFFKNPYIDAAMASALQAEYGQVPLYPVSDEVYKVAAGWLIDKANCRGIKHGQVGTWGKQALVIVNLGGAKPHEIVALAKYICAEVKSKFSIDLVPEVRLYGKHGEQAWDQI